MILIHELLYRGQQGDHLVRFHFRKAPAHQTNQRRCIESVLHSTVICCLSSVKAVRSGECFDWVPWTWTLCTVLSVYKVDCYFSCSLHKHVWWYLISEVVNLFALVLRFTMPNKNAIQQQIPNKQKCQRKNAWSCRVTWITRYTNRKREEREIWKNNWQFHLH